MDGLHHITAMAGDPQANVDFYVQRLGLRLVKKTVNYDDPATYHFYYGDAVGTPGTVLTFFPWPGTRRGQPGPGQATRITFQVAGGSLSFWCERLRDLPSIQSTCRFGKDRLQFHDPDGLGLEIVESEKPRDIRKWEKSTVPPEHQLRGFDGVTLTLDGHEPTVRVLELMDARFVAEEQNYFRYRIGNDVTGANIDLLCAAGDVGSSGIGLVHHVAWAAADDAEQEAWVRKLTSAGLHVSPVMDRNYFHSIYYREPGGVLFEIATLGPGFCVDEAVETLGERLMLPDKFEAQRSVIERALPPLS